MDDKDALQGAPGVPTSFRGPDVYLKRNPADIILLGKECLQYAIRRYDTRREGQIANITRNFNSYNGLLGGSNGMDYLNKTYGKNNVIKFVDWRLGRVKMDLMVGEVIKRPMNATCYTINKHAVMAKLDDFHAQLGLKYAKDHIERIKAATGVQPFDDMQPLEGSPEQIWDKMNAKTENEMLMQIILKKIIEVEDVKTKAADNFSDITIASECFSKQYIDDKGIVRDRNIDCRDALFEETDKDPFLLQSPYLGERRLMFEHDIMQNWAWTAKEREEIRGMFKAEINNNVSSNGAKRRNYIYSLQQHRALETFTLEWYAVKPFYTLYKPDNSGRMLTKALDYNWYNENTDRVDYDIRKKGARLETKYKLVLWEATQIGPEMFKNIREVPNIIGNIENPYETVSNYSGLLFNTKDGVRISLQQSLDSISELYNVVMWQIRREVNKAKGKVIPVNRAWLPKKVTMKQFIHQVVNEGIYDFDTSGDANYGSQRQSVQQAMKEIDWGVSESIGRLLEIKANLEQTADRLTGINDNREGNIAASSTATNANSSIQISRTITEYMFYMFSKYTENRLKKIMEHGKLAFGELNPELGRMLLGDAAIRFLHRIKDLPNDAFGLSLSDGAKELELRRKFEEWLPQAINAKELRIMDAIQIDMTESVNEAMAVAKQGWEEVTKITNQTQQQNIAAQSQDTEKKIVASKELKIQEYRAKIDNTIIAGLIKAGLVSQEAVNQYMADMKRVQMEQDDVDNEIKAMKASA